MDKRNRLSSYIDPATGDHEGGGSTHGNSAANRNRQQSSSQRPSKSNRDTKGGSRANRTSGGKGSRDDSASTQESLDAVANYRNYSRNKPSNPLSKTPRRTDRDDVFSDDANDYDTLDEVNLRPSSASRRREYPRESQQPSQQRRQQPQPRPSSASHRGRQEPARLTYYNEGQSPSGADGYKDTPRQGHPSSATRPSRRHDSARHQQPPLSSATNNRRAYEPQYDARNADLVDSRPQSARVRPGTQRDQPRQMELDPAYLRQERPSGLVETPAAYEDEEDPYDANGSFDDYVSPSKRDNGRYSVGDEHDEDRYGYGSQPASRSRRRGAPSQSHEGMSSSAVSPDSRQQSRAQPQQPAGPAQFLVRVHRVRDAFDDFEEAGKPTPTTFMSVHTTEERGRTGVVTGEYDPIFNDEFLFTSSRPDKDAVVLTLVAASHETKYPNRRHSTARDKRVAEAIISLQNLERGVERERWVTLVRHAGTPDAYERGEVLVSLITEDYGQTTLPTEEEEAVYYDEVHDMLVAHAPEELHRLDWFVGNVCREGPEGLARLRAKMNERSQEPVKVRLTVAEVSGLTTPEGRPSPAGSCYVVIRTPKGSEVTTKAVPYRQRATFEQTFLVTLRNPDVDAVSLAVYSAGRKLGETQVGLTNVQAGVTKDVALMLVRAAETGDAAPAGEISVKLQTDGYSSPHQMSASREARLRERVTAYLWSYLRDDLHRLDAIVAGIDDEDAYMKEWARTIGPEKKPKHASLRIARVTDVFGPSKKEGSGNASGIPPRVYMRVVVGPKVHRTETALVRNGDANFKSPIDVVVYDPKTDSIEFMLIQEAQGGVEKEISRVVLGTAGLPRGESIVRHVKLVKDALGRSAKVQGEVEVELVAHDFGVPLEKAITDETKYRYLCERLQGVTERSNPEALHRVAYMVDSAPPGKAEQAVEKKTREYGGEVASAPMTLRLLGLREFRQSGDVYVKAFLNGEAILRTNDKKASTDMKFDIADNNETTVKLNNANKAQLVFKIAHHRSCVNTDVIARTELSLRSMVRGEKNTVWIPLFEGSADQFRPEKEGEGNGRDGEAAASSKGKDKPFSGSRMPQWVQEKVKAAGGSSRSGGAAGSTKPLGLLGVMVQSNAFTGTTVTEYDVNGSSEDGAADDNSAATGESGPNKTRGGSGGAARPSRHGNNRREGGSSGQGTSTVGAVTRDVTTLLMKYRPQELSKVQPLIADSSSLKEAHKELRDRFAPRPIAATVYVNIERVELATAQGRAQEEQCGVRVDVSYGDEHQSTTKEKEFENDVRHQRERYLPVRLDIPVLEPNDQENGRGRGRAGKGNAVGSTPPLEIRLVGASGSDSAGGRSRGNRFSSFFDQRDANQHNSRPNGQQEPRRGASSHGNDTRHGAAGAGDNGDSVSPRRTSIGGANNLVNYLEESAVEALDPPSDTAASDSPYAYNYKGDESGNQGTSRVSQGLGQQQPSQQRSSRRSGTQDYAEQQPHSSASRRRPSFGRSGDRNQKGKGGNGAAALQGDIGCVHLSLRALLSAPIHRVGDAIRVPIVRPTATPSFGQSNQSYSAQSARNVIGHVTLRLSLPMFETVPESLRLANRATLSEVEPRYVHYYERRIGVYLRENNPADLVDFHYKLYERDVASGNWPTSLYDWMQALVKRFGPETTNMYGPEPALPFDPEERERQRDVELSRARESAFGNSEAASYAGGDASGRQWPPGGWLGEDPYLADDAGYSPAHGADDIYEVTEEDRAAHADRKHGSSRHPRSEGVASGTSRRQRQGDKSGAPHTSRSASKRKSGKQDKDEQKKNKEEVYGF